MILWGEEVSFKNELLAMLEIEEMFENSMKKHAIYFTDKKLKGKAVVTGKDENGDFWKINPWIFESFDYIKEIIRSTPQYVNSVLGKYGQKLNLDWDEVNLPFYIAQQKFVDLRKMMYEMAGVATQEEYNQVYDKAYFDSLSQSNGMGFGIISSSIIANLIYAAQATAQARKDEERATRDAIAATGNNPQILLENMASKMKSFYEINLEPKIYEMLSSYYGMIFQLLINGLDLSEADFSNTFNKQKSDELLAKSTCADSAKINIVNALNLNPNNGKTVLYAIQYEVLDDEFIQYCRAASDAFKQSVREAFTSKIEENLEYVRYYDKPLVNERNLKLIQGIKKYFSLVEDVDNSRNEKWNKFISYTYSQYLKNISNKINIWKELISSFSITSKLRKSENPISEGKKILDEAKLVANSQEIVNLFYFADHFEFSEARGHLIGLGYKSMQDFANALNNVKNNIDKITERVVEESNMKAKKREELKIQIEEKKRQIVDLGLALFGKKAQDKKRFTLEIESLNKELKELF